MLIGTLPILVAGLAIKGFWPGYETSALRGITSIAIVSIVMALLLALAESVGRRRRDLPQVRPIDGALVGMAQALAVIPGVSRSGSTLTASYSMAGGVARRRPFLLPAGYPGHQPGRAGGAEDGFCR